MTKHEFDNDFITDALKILKKRTNGTVVHRRRFLSALGLLGVMPLALRFTPAHAQSNELVIVNWGGDALPAFEKVLAAPYTKDGITAIVDGSGPSSGKIRAMVEAHAVTWDVCDRNLPASIELGKDNLLEEIDWNIVDPNKVRDVHRSKWGVGSYLYTFALTWDSEAHSEAPKNWADFWNLKDYPGTRTLRNNIEGMLETALLADGVAPSDIYPIDVERAFAQINEIKEHTIFWSSGSQSQELFRNKEVSLGNIWHTRAMLLRDETQGRIKYDFNQGILFAGAWIVPKGNPAGKKVWDFLATTQDPNTQVELFKLLGNGPINPIGSEMLSVDMRVDDPGSPDNFARQVAADADWYAQNYGEILNQYTDLISS